MKNQETPDKPMLVQLTNPFGGKVRACASHIDANRKYLPGDGITESLVEGECEDCRQELQHWDAPAKMRDALTSPRFSHTRFRNWCGVGAIYAYHRDPSSPSGVMLAESLDEPRYEALAEQMRAEGLRVFSPLSPTEGL